MSDSQATETLGGEAPKPVVTEGHVRIGDVGFGEVDPLGGLDPVAVKRKSERKRYKTLGFGDGIYGMGVLFDKLDKIERQQAEILELLTSPKGKK